MSGFLGSFCAGKSVACLILEIERRSALSTSSFALINSLVRLFGSCSSGGNLKLASRSVGVGVSMRSPNSVLMFTRSPRKVAVVKLVMLFVGKNAFSVGMNGFRIRTGSPAVKSAFSGVIGAIGRFLGSEAGHGAVGGLDGGLSGVRVRTPATVMSVVGRLKASFAGSSSSDASRGSV